MLDADAGAHNTLKSANPYPFGMLLLCEGVGREPPLQRFEQGGAETGGIKAGSQTGVYGGCGGGWEKKGSLLRDSSGMWLTRPGQARHLGSELHKGLGSSDHPHKEKKKSMQVGKEPVVVLPQDAQPGGGSLGLQLLKEKGKLSLSSKAATGEDISHN